MRVSVVILNWNGIDFLRKFLPSLINSCEGLAEVVVADNASTDNSLSFILTHHTSVKIIEFDKNYGFTGGYNRALKQINTEYYVLLNSDVEVSPHWLPPLIELMDSDPSIAACQPKMLAHHQKDYFEYAGAAGGFIDFLGYPFCRGRIFQELEKDVGQYNDNKEVFWASGACMFIRSSCYHEVEGLDEQFFAHMEEIDLCWRLKNRGHKIMYCGSSFVYHVGGGTLPKSNPRKTYLNFRNNLSMVYKNGKGIIIFKILARTVLDSIAAVKFLLSGGIKESWAVFRAHFSFYRRLPYLHLARQNNKKTKFLNAETGILKKSIVFLHYLKGTRNFNDIPKKFW